MNLSYPKTHEEYHEEFTKYQQCEDFSEDIRYAQRPTFWHPFYPVNNLNVSDVDQIKLWNYIYAFHEIFQELDPNFDEQVSSNDSIRVDAFQNPEYPEKLIMFPILWGSEAILYCPFDGARKDELISMLDQQGDIDYLVCLDPFEYVNLDYSEFSELEFDDKKYRLDEVRCRGFNLTDQSSKKNIDVSTSRELYWFHYALTCFSNHHLIKDNVSTVESLADDSIIDVNALSLLVAKRTSLFLSKNLSKLRRNVKQIELLTEYVQSVYNINEACLNKLVKMQKKIQERDGFVFRTPKLKNQSKESFFNDLVVKVFEHDDLHLVMAHKEKPAYSFFQEENSQVSCSKDMFFNDCDQETRINAVLEEAYVIALERKVIPFLFLKGKFTTPIHAFEWAVWRICTNLTSGWFRQFACDNVEEVMSRFDHQYLDIFIQAYENNQIIELEKKDESV